MSDLIDRIRRLQREIGEAVVIADLREKGLLAENDPASADLEPINYCLSVDNERFEGSYASIDAALAGARKALSDGRPLLEPQTVWIGEKRPAIKCVDATYLGDRIYEYIQDALFDEMGGACERFAMDDAQKTAMGGLVLNWLERNVGFHCHAVDNITEHTIGRVD